MIALFWLSCARAPDPCEAMCLAAAELYGGCLTSWDLDWSAAGYNDEAAFLESCRTWAWQGRILEEDAGEKGRIDALCEDRAALFSADTATCEDFTDLDWSA